MADNNKRVDADPLAHLVSFSLRAVALGFGLALCSLFALILITFTWGSISSLFIPTPQESGAAMPLEFDFSEPTFLEKVIAFLQFSGELYLLILLHTVFIVALVARLINDGRSIFGHFSGRSIFNGAKLALWFMPFALLDIFSTSYQCADGKAFDVSAIPMLPWLWIGWLILNVAGVTARYSATNEQFRHSRSTISDRIYAVLPLSLPVIFFGYVFQIREIDCTPPFDGFGFMEGGVVLFPLLGAFWFFMSVSTAVIAAISVAPPLVYTKNDGGTS